jgi:hypothetical protein
MQLWRYQGLKTLGDYLRKRDCVKELAMDLQVPEHLAVPTVLKHLLESIQVRHLPLSQPPQVAGVTCPSH